MHERAEMLIWTPAHDKDLKKRHTVSSVRAHNIHAYRIKCVLRRFFAQAEAANAGGKNLGINVSYIHTMLTGAPNKVRGRRHTQR